MSSVRQRGETFTAYWFVTVNGKRVQRTKGGFKKETAAKRHGQEQEVAARAPGYREPTDKKLTVAQLLDEHWLPHFRTTATRSGEPPRANTIAQVEIAVKSWVKPYVGEERVLALTPVHVEQMIATLRARGGRKGKPLGERGIQAAYIVLRRALDFAVLRGFAPTNVAAVVGRPGVKQREMSCWTAEEAQAFLHASAEDRLYAAWVLLLARGLRRGELAGLRWDAIDLEAGHLRITRTRVSIGGKVIDSTPKTRAGRRRIPLDAGLIAVLKAHRDRQRFEARGWGESWAESGYVFVREDGAPLHPESISQRFDRLIAKHKLSRIRLHDCRHTAASLMLEDGTPVKVAAEMLGHSNPNVTQATYQHVLPGMAESAGERLSGRLLGGLR
ncbi:MAG TPA: tyrosine-type recombinase/integrase [Mycobacteriales bacterium]|nr:tyrosine-type recombinase/integrase [Mycobacteriales bacterium]